MASSYSFDVVSEVSMQEVDNAINQAKKELPQRYDLKGSNGEITFDPKEKLISIQADGEHFVNAIYEIIQQKCVKRNVSLLSLDRQDIEPSGGRAYRQKILIKDGLSKEEAKEISQLIRDSKIKVTTQIQDDKVRVTGKDKDDLQKTIAMLKSSKLDFPLQFTNYR